MNRLSSLLRLEFRYVPLYDTGLFCLCLGLLRHPTLRDLCLAHCSLSSNSCDPVRHLIPTLPQLNKLRMYGNTEELSTPDSNPYKLLKQTAALIL